MGYRDPGAKKSFAYPFPAIALTIMGALKLATRVKVSRILIFAKPKSDKVRPDGSSRFPVEAARPLPEGIP